MLAALVAAAPAHAALTLTDVGGTFVSPIFATAPPGDGERLMVVLRDGDIRVVKNGATLAQPFLSIPDVDSPSGPHGSEAGLLSMAFAPSYRTSGRFYVFMVRDDANPADPPQGPIEIREYTRSAANPDVADPATKRTVLEIEHAATARHYGGTLQFGPDGLLYASIGDGGTGGDTAGNPSSQLGKLLRLDPRRLGSAPYRVPASNPYASGIGGDPLVYSLGLRNPFRFSFDRQNGDLTIGDVGQSDFEEVDFAPSPGRGSGTDFGWNSCEGFMEYPGGTVPCTTGTRPVYAYENPPTGCAAVTGGVVVRDPGLPDLAGKYVFGDFCTTYVKSIDLAIPAATNETTLPVLAGGVTAFGEDACGRVHLVLLESGQVQRLEDDAAPGTCDLQVTYLPPVPDPEGASPPPVQARPAVPKLAFLLAGSLRQRPLRSGNVGVRVRCDRACSARTIGLLSLKLKGKRIRLREALGRLGAAGTLTLRLRVPAKARRSLRRALLSRRSVRAALTVRVRDAAGTLSLRQRTVRLVR